MTKTETPTEKEKIVIQAALGVIAAFDHFTTVTLQYEQASHMQEVTWQYLRKQIQGLIPYRHRNYFGKASDEVV